MLAESLIAKLSGADTIGNQTSPLNVIFRFPRPNQNTPNPLRLPTVDEKLTIRLWDALLGRDLINESDLFEIIPEMIYQKIQFPGGLNCCHIRPIISESVLVIEYDQNKIEDASIEGIAGTSIMVNAVPKITVPTEFSLLVPALRDYDGTHTRILFAPLSG